MTRNGANAYGKYQAKETYYRGIWFKSNLEARVAEALDKLGIAWEYETRCFRDQRFVGGQYTPDFWLPDCLTYLEVAGVIDDRHMKNALVFCETQNVNNPIDYIPKELSLLTETAPAYLFVDHRGCVLNPLDMNADIWITGCKRDHGHRSFVAAAGGYECRICGSYDGDHQMIGDACLL